MEVLQRIPQEVRNLAMTGVKYAHTDAQLKTGTIGIKVSIMPSDVHFPDKVTFITEETAAMTEKLPRKKKPLKRSLQNRKFN